MMYVLFIFAVIIAAKGEEDCGRVTPGGIELPWQAGIYKNAKPIGNNPPQLSWWCSATLISNKAVLTAAHNVFTRLSKVQPVPPSGYSVAVGSQPWPWREPADITTQYSQVISIHLAPGFQHRGSGGAIEYYADDIAVVIVDKAFVFSPFIQPICLNFEYDFEQKQLKDGAMGKTPGWLYEDYDTQTKPDYFLQIKQVYHVPLTDCLDDRSTEGLDANSVKILTLAVSDKICFGAKQNNSAPCNYESDDGSGVAFPAMVNGKERWYLRGVLSGPLDDEKDCTIDTFYMFTSILKHETFIRKYWGSSENTPQETRKCVLPPLPKHGSYTSNHTRVIATGGYYDLETLTVSCERGYDVLGSCTVSCLNGFWLQSMPKCVRMCLLTPHPSVEYRCLVSSVGGSRNCNQYEPPGTLVRPRCNAPHYYSTSTLAFMSCSEDGYWDYTARCSPECGRVTPEGTQLVVGGVPAKRGELPWHVGIYKKTYIPYQQVCGGSLISNNLIISAAHCFWSDLEKQLPATQFAVAVGKIYRPWDDKVDDAQKSEVKAIHLPPRFQGASSNFQDDIAVVVAAESFEYKIYVRPVCLSFDSNFDRLQLQIKNKGKIAGWGLTAENGNASPILQVTELPYVDVGTCIADSPPTFSEYITSDKICAGASSKPNSALCKGDSGGGLAFPASDRGTERYYLRGVVSTAPNNEHACNTATYTSFTQILKHEDFIKQFLMEL